jgi:hypothetical protein
MLLQRKTLMTKLPIVRLFLRILCAALFAVLFDVSLLTTSASAKPVPPPLANAVILIIRHAEKPDQGAGLTVIGQQRASDYPDYFLKFPSTAAPLRLDHLIAAADTPHSQRPRLTLEPLSTALHLPIDDQIPDKEVGRLAETLHSHSGGQAILICWHHKEIPALIRALGADPSALLPGGKWPDSVFGWIIQLRYDQMGHLIPSSAKRINEHLMPDDAESAN